MVPIMIGRDYKTAGRATIIENQQESTNSFNWLLGTLTMALLHTVAEGELRVANFFKETAG